MRIVSQPLHRRTLLRGAGISIALPFLHAMRTRVARAATPVEDRKMIFWFHPNGQDTKRFHSTGVGTGFKLGTNLAPLEKIRNDLLIPRKLDNKAAMAAPNGSNGHNAGMVAIMTSTPLSPQSGLPNVNNELRGYASGPSIDWVLSQKAPGASKLKEPLMVLGTQETRGYEFGSRDPYSYTSYKGAGGNNAIGAETNPYTVFKRLFSDMQAGTGVDVLAATHARRKSLLDFVATRHDSARKRIEAKLGAEDKILLEKHLTAIREIEQRVTVGVASGCQSPTLGANNDYGTPARSVETKLGLAARTAPACGGNTWGTFGNPNDGTSFPDVMRAQTDIAVIALACGLTRIVTLQHSCAQGGPSFSWICAPGHHHGITHNLFNGQDQEAENKISLWYANEFVYLVEALRKVPTASGTLLDDTGVIWLTELSDAAGHSMNDLPIVMAGRCGGAFKTGQLTEHPGRSQGDLFVNILNAMGVPDKTFGDARFSSGALPGLG
jgi:Protein of unknown function (DUF1552)